jgi:hypothetical protein
VKTNLKPCRKCGREVAIGATICPGCGVLGPAPWMPFSPWYAVGGFVVLVVSLASVGRIKTHCELTEGSAITLGLFISLLAPASPASHECARQSS